MPGFLNRAWNRFQARTAAEKFGIILGVFIVVVVASQIFAVLASLAFFAAAIIFMVQLFRRRPARVWAIAAGGSLVAVVLFSSIAGAIYGPETDDQAQTNQTEKSRQEKQRPTEPTPEQATLHPRPHPSPRLRRPRKRTTVGTTPWLG